MAAKKLQRSHAALKGIDSKNGFLSDETLLQLVGSDSFNTILKKHQNERLRSFRDQYREFDQKLQKTNEAKAKDTDKRKKLLGHWFQTLQSYLGYNGFVVDQIPHWDYKGSIPYLKSPEQSHSVAVLFSAQESVPLDVETSGYYLTTIDGEVTYEAHKKETLSEQVEKFMKAAGCAEVILLLAHSAYYFRSESQTAGQYLEIRWSDMLLEDNDAALSLATHICHADFFAYNQTQETAETEGNKDADEASEEDEESESGGSTKTQTTTSSLLFREDLEQARKITEDLHKQVTLALEILINERLQIDEDLKKRAKTQTHNQEVANQLFKDGLFVLYRVLFILYAEARKFLPIENQQYASFYSMEHLRNWSEEFLKRERQGLADPEGTYLWGAFRSLFTLLRRGVKLNGGEYVSAFNGQLFAPDQSPTFDNGPALRDKAVAEVLITLSRVGGVETGRRLHFANLGVEQLGAVYEALLAQKAVIVREPSVWVPAHGGGIGLVTEELATALEMPRFEDTNTTQPRARRQGRAQRGAAGHLENFISPMRPGFVPSVGKFIIAPLGGQKRQTASFYTPPKLAEFLVKRTLKPQVEGKSPEEILGLRIVEPAVGSGGFLIATMRYLGQELLKSKMRTQNIDLRGREPNHEDLQKCKREILEHCLFGVDYNPLSLELCRTSLYLEALVKNQPLPFLHHRLRSGNSLIYADFMNKSKATWDDATEFPSLFNVYSEALDIDKKIFEAWDAKQKAFGKSENSDEIAEKISEIKQDLKEERNKIIAEEWADWAIKSQSKVNNLLQLARKAVTEFERIQERGDVVDSLDARYKDRLAWIPELDDVLIEAEGIEVDSRLENERKKVLVREHGKTGYGQMVRYQRAFSRLKALGDLWCAQWFWPLEEMKHFPTLTTFKEVADYLLDEKTLERGKKSKQPLSKAGFQLLLLSARIAKEHRFFQWHVEFAQVFADIKNGGFTNIISNPPWKQLRTTNKDFIPLFVPFYMSMESNQKRFCEEYFQEDSYFISSWYGNQYSDHAITKFCKKSGTFELKLSGQVDICAYFILSSRTLLSKKGRSGLIVSRPAILVNASTKELREDFFKQDCLVESFNYINENKLFNIPRHQEFTLLLFEKSINDHTPLFYHGLTEVQQAEAACIGRSTSSNPVAIDIKTIKRVYSKEVLSIPRLTSTIQQQISSVLAENEFVTYLDRIGFIPKKGIDQKHPALKPIDDRNIKSDEILVYRGRDISHWNFLDSSEEVETSTVAKKSKLKNMDNTINSIKVAWRGVALPTTNQRSIMPGIILPNTICDQNVYFICAKDLIDAKKISLLFGNIVNDFILRLLGATFISQGTALGVPIVNIESKYFENALKLSKQKYNSRELERVKSEIDANMIMHTLAYNGLQLINNKNLEFIFSDQFQVMKNNHRDYIEKVISSVEKMKGVHKDTYFYKNKIFTENIVDEIFTTEPSIKSKRSA